MSDSRAKYEELTQKKGYVEVTQHQKSLQLICEILYAASKADLVEELINKALEVSKTASNLTPATVFQIAADGVKVDELCNKIK